MSNIFMEDRSHHIFKWEKLGNIKEGRGDLGEDMPVVIYRLLEYSINHILAEEYGVEQANELFRKAGFLAGTEFAKNMLDLTQELSGLFAQLQQVMKDLKIGILRVESVSEQDGTIFLTVAQDLDCSGLPPTNEVVCNYDEGFISGILEAYTNKPYFVREVDCWASGTNKPYFVREVDCWASGDRVCRFRCATE